MADWFSIFEFSPANTTDPRALINVYGAELRAREEAARTQAYRAWRQAWEVEHLRMIWRMA